MLKLFTSLLFVGLVCHGVMAQNLIIDGGISTNISSGTNSFANTVVGFTSDGNSLTVQNPATLLTNSLSVFVGLTVSQNSLIVTNGAAVSGSQILVGSYGGNNDTLTVAGAGTVTGASMWIGYQTGPQNMTVITGNGSSLNVTSGFYVGDGSDSNSITVSAGGKFTSTGGAIIGLTSDTNSSPGMNNSVLITGAGSQWSNTGGLTIGQTGSGTLSLGSGATVTSDSITIASSSNSAGTMNVGGLGAGNTNMKVSTGFITFGDGNGSLNFNQADTTVVSGDLNTLNGHSTINQAGSGTTILSGNNLDYNGDVTIAGGVLQVGTNGTNGPFGPSGMVRLSNNATFIINIDHDYQYTMSNKVSGNGSLLNSGGGNLILAGNNDYAGITIIQAVNCQCSGIQVGNGGTNGSLGTGTLILNATNHLGTNFYPTIGFDRSDLYVVSNTIISGLGKINQDGSGTTVLAGDITLHDTNFPTNGGTVFVNNGGLVISGNFDGGTNSYLDVGTTNIPVTMSFTSNSVTTLNSIIIGSQPNQTNPNVSGSNLVTVDHATINLAAVLSVGGPDGPGGNVMVISNGSKVSSTNLWVGADSDNNQLIVTGTNTTLTVNGSTVGTYIGDAGNSNSLTISNGATLTTIGQTYIGTIFIPGTGEDPGSNNFVLVTGTNSKWTNTGVINVGDSGTGTLTIAQGGSVGAGSGIVLASSNGSTGTLNIGDYGKNDAGGTLTTPTIAFGSGSGTINLNQNNTVTLTSSITGLGSVNQLGSGTSILSGNNTYTGTTTINDGTVETTTENALGSSMVNLNAGTLALMSKLTITSPFTWNSAALVAIKTLGNNNYLNATGPVFLTGSGLHYFNLTGNSLGLTPEPLFHFGTNGFSVSKFGVIGLSNYNLFTSNNILYIIGLANPTNPVTPTNAPETNTPPPPLPLQPSIYQSLSTIAFSIANSQNNDFIERMSGIRTSENGDSMSGIPDNAPVIQNDGKNVIEPVDDKNPVDGKNPIDFKSPVSAKNPSSILQPGLGSHWGMFVDLNGIYSQANSVNMIPSYNVMSGGGLAGPIYHWSENLTTGIYAGYQGTYVNYGGGSTLKDNSVRFGLFGTYGEVGGKGYYVDAMAGGGYHNYQVTRAINFLGLNDTATSSPGAGELDAMLAGGYDFKRGNWTFGPVANAQYTYFSANSVNETGAQNLDFNSGGWETSSLIGSLGGHVNYLWQANRNIVVVPQINLSWQHEFLQNPYAINGSLGGGPQFSMTSTAPLRDTLYTGIGFTVNFYRKWNTALFYNTDLGNNAFVSQNLFWSAGVRF